MWFKDAWSAGVCVSGLKMRGLQGYVGCGLKIKVCRVCEGVGCGLKMRGLQGCWVWF